MSNEFDASNLDGGMLAPRPRNKAIIITVIVLLVVVLAVASALIVKLCVISTFVVEGVSMYPTLDGGAGAESDGDPTNGEILYLNRLAKIRRGDIVVFTPGWDSEDRSLVKRVIGVAGDTVEVKDGKVFLNGAAIAEPYINQPMSPEETGIWKVAEGYIFCMGDNRNFSLDCRVYGPISLDCVEGRCFLIKGLNGKLRKP